MARISRGDAEHLLSGTTAPGRPEADTELVRLVEAMRAPAGAHELEDQGPAVAGIAAAIRQSHSSIPVRRQRMLTKVLSTKAAAVVAVVLAGGSAAAAATGSLPAPAQHAVSSALSHVAISVPNPNHHANQHANEHGNNDVGAPAKGPDANGSAKFGLCTAWAAGSAGTNPHSHKDSSVAFTNLQDAAKAAHKSVADFCKGVTPPHETTTTHGPAVSTPNHGEGNPEHPGNSASHADNGASHANNHRAGRP